MLSKGRGATGPATFATLATAGTSDVPPRLDDVLPHLDDGRHRPVHVARVSTAGAAAGSTWSPAGTPGGDPHAWPHDLCPVSFGLRP